MTSQLLGDTPTNKLHTHMYIVLGQHINNLF